MKKHFLLILLLASVLQSAKAQNYDFSAVAPSGQTLYYKVENPMQFPDLYLGRDVIHVSVVSPDHETWGSFTKPTGHLLIPRNIEHNNETYVVTRINGHSFSECTGLLSVSIPVSVNNVESVAFDGCTGLISVFFGSFAVNEDELDDYSMNEFITIRGGAFSGCTNLHNVFGLNDVVASAESFMGRFDVVRGSEDKLVMPSYISASGGGEDWIYKISDDFHITDVVEAGTNEIPYYALPPNFIGKHTNGNWLASEIMLTDGPGAFKAPVAFSAEKVTYTRRYTQGDRSTLCLPFKPDNVSSTGSLKYYRFDAFDGSTITFSEVDFEDFAPYTPYLVEWPASKAQADFVFSANNVTIAATGNPASIVRFDGGSFIGTMERTCMDGFCYGYSGGYFVRSADEWNIFDVHAGHAHVTPFRAYFEIIDNGPQSLPPLLGVEFGDGSVGIDAVEDAQDSPIRYSNDVYDMMGRLVRKEAEDLRGLPQGIYIWRGKKVFAY